MEFIKEIRTGKRRINKKIINFIDSLFVICMIGMMWILTLSIIGIDLWV